MKSFPASKNRLHQNHAVEAKAQENSELQRQLTVALDEVDRHKAENLELRNTLDESSWQEEKSRLLEALEEEKDKVSTWEEEKNNLEAQLSVATEKSNELEAEKSVLRQEIDESSWKEEKEQILSALEEEKDKTSTWEEEKFQLEAHLREALSENDALREENSNIRSSVDAMVWRREREQLLAALEVEREKIASWKEEQMRIQQEVKLLKEVEKSVKMKDVIVGEMQETIAQLRSDLDDAWAKMSIKQDVIDGLKTSLMENGGEEWVKEKMTLVDRISETKLALSALEETYEEERSRHVATRIMKEDLELQVDKITKEIQDVSVLRSQSHQGCGRRHVTWGENEIKEVC